MYLYVVKEEKLNRSNKRPSMLKIGIAHDPQQRMKSLQTSNPNDLCFLHLVKCKGEAHAREVERDFHRRLAQFHIRGEWFRGDAIGRFAKQMFRCMQIGRAKQAKSTSTSVAMWELI